LGLYPDPRQSLYEMEDKHKIDLLIEAGKKELAELESRRTILIERVNKLKKQKPYQPDPTISQKPEGKITRLSPEDEKIALFHSLFKRREDVFPKRFESQRVNPGTSQLAETNGRLEHAKSLISNALPVTTMS